MRYINPHHGIYQVVGTYHTYLPRYLRRVHGEDRKFAGRRAQAQQAHLPIYVAGTPTRRGNRVGRSLLSHM